MVEVYSMIWDVPAQPEPTSHSRNPPIRGHTWRRDDQTSHPFSPSPLLFRRQSSPTG